MWCKHPINATTNRPAGCGVGGLATILKTTNGDPYVCTCMRPGGAALKVEQHVGHHGVSDAGRQGVEPLVIEVSDGRETSECSAWECPAFAVACVIKQFAGADDKSASRTRNRSQSDRHRQSQNRLRRLLHQCHSHWRCQMPHRCCRRCSSRSRWPREREPSLVLCMQAQASAAGRPPMRWPNQEPPQRRSPIGFVSFYLLPPIFLTNPVFSQFPLSRFRHLSIDLDHVCFLS